MKVELNRKELLHLLEMADLSYELMTKLEKEKLGYYAGGFDARWVWTIPDSFTEQEIWNLYNESK